MKHGSAPENRENGEQASNPVKTPGRNRMRVGALRIAARTFRNAVIELADFVTVMEPGPLLHDWLLLWLPSVVVSQGVLGAAAI